MKKIISILLAAAMLACLCACGGSKTIVSGSDVSVTPNGPATDTDIPENIDALVAASLLNDILKEISSNLHEDTAGSSLTASAFAGRILDLNAGGKLSGKSARDTTKDFFAALDSEAAEEFPAQLNLVYSAAVALCGETGSSELEASGYEAESFPWNSGDAESFFSAIYKGAGLDMPE